MPSKDPVMMVFNDFLVKCISDVLDRIVPKHSAGYFFHTNKQVAQTLVGFTAPFLIAGIGLLIKQGRQMYLNYTHTGTDYLVELGNKAMTEFNYEKALTFFESARKIDTKNRDIIIYQAEAFYALKRKKEAVACMNELLKLRTQNQEEKANQEEGVQQHVQKRNYCSIQ